MAQIQEGDRVVVIETNVEGVVTQIHPVQNILVVDVEGKEQWLRTSEVSKVEPRQVARKYKFSPVDGEPYEDEIVELTLHLPGGGVRKLKPEDIPMGFTNRYYIKGDDHLVMSIAKMHSENEMIPFWRLEHKNARGTTYLLEGPTGAVPYSVLLSKEIQE